MATHVFRACCYASWATVAVAFGGCRQESVAPLCQVTKLANQEVAAVDKALGNPASVVPIRESPSRRAGEYRQYALSVGARVRVRFFQGKATSFSFSLQPPARSAEAALRAIGLDAGALTVTDYQDTVKTWRGSADEIAFDGVTATTGQGGLSTWSTVDVMVQGAPE